MKHFLDRNGNRVVLSFSKNPFDEQAKHVLILCQYQGGWMLTKHKERGLEFPGGKVENEENLEEAAKREVYEETGAVISELKQIAEYKVTDQNGSFVKAVFWGTIKEVHLTKNYFETDGPIIIQGDILTFRHGAEYSFIMKDQVIEECVRYIENKKE